MKRSIFILLMSALSIPTLVWAAGAVFYTTDFGGDPLACEVPPGAGLVTLFVFVQVDGGLKSFDLWAPVPACYSGAVTDNMLHPFTGDPQSSAEVTFTNCPTAGVELVMIRELLVDGLSTQPCCEFTLETSNALDCVGSAAGPVGGSFALVAADQQCRVTEISNTFPPDGADQQSTHVVLRYDFELAPNCANAPSAPQELFYFGTDPNNLVAETPTAVGGGTAFLDPGGLAYGTTYYWRAFVGYAFGSGQTPTMSFTTIEPPVSVRITTWGAIKAVYVSEQPN